MKKSRPSRRITTPLLSPESPMISPLFTLHPMGSRIVSPFAIAPGRAPVDRPSSRCRATSTWPHIPKEPAPTPAGRG